MNKIKLLFDELQKKYPDIIDETFVSNITKTVESLVESEIESKKEKIISETIENEKEKIRTEVTESVTNNIDSMNEETINKLIDTMDVFFEEATKDFTEEYSEKIDESIKTNISTEVVEKINEVLESHGIKTSDAVLEKELYEENIKKLNNTIMSLTEQVNENHFENVKNQAIGIVDNICENMSYQETLNFYKLIEDFDIDDLDSFKEKVESLSNILEGKSKKKNKDEEDDEEDDDDDMNEKFKSKKVNKKDLDLEDEEDEDTNESVKYPNDNFMSEVRKNLSNKIK